MPDIINREWKDLDEKWHLLENGRVTSFSVSIDQPMDYFRDIGVIPIGARNITFSIEGHIIQQDKPHPDNHHFVDDGNIRRVQTFALLTHSIVEAKPTKRKYKRKEYEIMVKHKDGHFTQDTFRVSKKRIGKIPKRIRTRQTNK